MQTSADRDLWEKEQDLLAHERENRPESFVVSPAAKNDLQQRVGITVLPEELPSGYIRHSPLDFLIEEIGPSGQVSPVADGPEQAAAGDGQGTVYADLVKVGLATPEAVRRVAESLGIGPESIRFAGSKDADAVSAQRISIRNSSLDKALSLDLPGILLNRCFTGKGAINVGDLNGHRFTVFVRTDGPVDKAWFQAKLAVLEKDGVVNYYGVQRFGPPRFLSHLFGMYLCQGDLPNLVKVFLTQASPTEVPYAARLREAAAGRYGDWPAMKEAMSAMPYSFRYELAMLEALARYPEGRGFPAAVSAVAQQADMWAKAYASYLANRLMSKAARGIDEVPEEIPMMLSNEANASKPYATYLRADRATDYLEHLGKFRFIALGKAQRVPVRLRPKILASAILTDGAALSFELPKAAYAMTVLTHLFDVASGFPEPDWVSQEEVDLKVALGMGDLSGIRKRFATVLAELAQARKPEGE